MSGVVCVVCPFADDEKLKNIHVDLAFISMRSCPPQYPRSSIPLTPSPSLFLCFSFFSFPPFSLIFLLLFAPFLFVFSLFLLSLFPDPPLFFVFGSFYFLFLFLFLVSVLFNLI